MTCAEVLLTTLSTALCAEPIQAVVDPVKPEPVTNITVPVGPEAGENPLMLCCGLEVDAALANVNEAELNAECVGLRMAIAPVVASAGTVTVACVLLITLRAASWPLPTQACVEPLKPVPVRVTNDPAAPLEGENPLIPCCGLVAAPLATVYAEAVNAACRGLRIAIDPVVASDGILTLA